jgi:hypothetical protein
MVGTVEVRLALFAMLSCGEKRELSVDTSAESLRTSSDDRDISVLLTKLGLLEL